MPALDVLEGRCVRLAGGDRTQVTVEGGDPAVAAARFAAEGASFLHVVDLNGAFDGVPSPSLLRRIVAAAGDIPVQVGGGYRAIAAVEQALAAGARRVVIGTAAISDAFLTDAVALAGPRLVVSVDVRGSEIAVDGWQRSARLRPDELGRRCAAAGVPRLVVTSTARDGSLAGPDLALIDGVMSASGLPVLAAGGIATLDDVRALRELGCEGAIVGSALWTGRFRLADALALENGRL